MGKSSLNIHHPTLGGRKTDPEYLHVTLTAVPRSATHRTKLVISTLKKENVST